MDIKCKNLHDTQIITVKYVDADVIATCECNTVVKTDNGHYVIDYEKLTRGIEAKINEKFER